MPVIGFSLEGRRFLNSHVLLYMIELPKINIYYGAEMVAENTVFISFSCLTVCQESSFFVWL